MKVKVQVTIEHDGDVEPFVADVACFERASGQLSPETLASWPKFIQLVGSAGFAKPSPPGGGCAARQHDVGCVCE